MGWIFTAKTIFNWQQILQLFETLSENPLVIRAKGIFNAGELHMLFQLDQQQIHRETSAYNQDSRLEIIFTHNDNDNQSTIAQQQTWLEKHLQQTIKHPTRNS